MCILKDRHKSKPYQSLASHGCIVLFEDECIQEDMLKNIKI